MPRWLPPKVVLPTSHSFLDRRQALDGHGHLCNTTDPKLLPPDCGAAFAALVMVMTVAASGGATAYYALMGDAFRPAERERLFGLIAATASLIGTVVTPVTLGLVLDRISARAPLVALTGAPLLGLAGVVLYRWASPGTNIRPLSDRNLA